MGVIRSQRAFQGLDGDIRSKEVQGRSESEEEYDPKKAHDGLSDMKTERFEVVPASSSFPLLRRPDLVVAR